MTKRFRFACTPWLSAVHPRRRHSAPKGCQAVSARGTTMHCMAMGRRKRDRQVAITRTSSPTTSAPRKARLSTRTPIPMRSIARSSGCGKTRARRSRPRSPPPARSSSPNSRRCAGGTRHPARSNQGDIEPALPVVHDNYASLYPSPVSDHPRAASASRFSRACASRSVAGRGNIRDHRNSRSMRIRNLHGSPRGRARRDDLEKSSNQVFQVCTVILQFWNPK